MGGVITARNISSTTRNIVIKALVNDGKIDSEECEQNNIDKEYADYLNNQFKLGHAMVDGYRVKNLDNIFDKNTGYVVGECKYEIENPDNIFEKMVKAVKNFFSKINEDDYEKWSRKHNLLAKK